MLILFDFRSDFIYSFLSTWWYFYIQFIEYFLVCYLFCHHQSPKVEAMVEQVNAWFKHIWIFLYVFSGDVRSTEGPVSISGQGIW